MSRRPDRSRRSPVRGAAARIRTIRAWAFRLPAGRGRVPMSDTPVRVSMAAFCVALIVSAVTTWRVRIWARAHDVVDRPGGHKAHEQPVALLGGIAIVAAVLLPMLIVLPAAYVLNWLDPAWVPASLRLHLPGLISKTPVGLAIIAGAIVLHVLGLLDDL